MNVFTIDKDNSPKFYLLLVDQYGDALDLTAADFITLEYSVYKVGTTTRTAVSGFSNVAINTSLNWYATTQTYPTGVVGLTSEDAEKGYNLTFFPYVSTTVSGVQKWASPFTESGTTYEIDVHACYLMEDSSLSGSAQYDRTETIRVITRS